MKIIPKIAAAVTLLFCFLSINFHNFTHFHGHHKEAESNFPDSRESEQYNISEQCDKCLSKDKNSYDLNFLEISHFALSNTNVCGFENHVGYSLLINLHSRPPPILVT